MSDFFDGQDFLAVFAPAVMPSLLKKEVTAYGRKLHNYIYDNCFAFISNHKKIMSPVSKADIIFCK